MKRNDVIAAALAVAFFAFFCIFFVDYVGLFGRAGDYQNMYACTKEGQFVQQSSEIGCAEYPPLIIWLGKLFASRELFYKQFILFLFAVLTPLILYRITDEPVVVWFYFSCTSFFYAAITGGWFAMAFAYTLIFAMPFLKTWQRLLIIPVSIIAHSSSLFVAIAFFLLLAIEELHQRKYALFPICSPFWGEVPESISKPMFTQGHSMGNFSLNTLGSVIVKRLPFPLLIVSIWKLVKMQKYALLSMLALFLFSGIIYLERISHFAALPMLCGLAWFWKDAKPQHRALLLTFSVLMFFFNIFQLINLGEVC